MVMTKAHDRFSLAAIMKFYLPAEDTNATAAWEEAIAMLPCDGGLPTARTALQKIIATSLRRVAPAAPAVQLGTGSPPHK